MSPTARPGTAALAAGGACAGGLAAWATAKGPGLSVDSVGYLSSGINIASGDGFLMLSDQALTIFPPGLPLVAAVGEAVGYGAEATLRVVSIVSAIAIVVLGGILAHRVVPHRPTAAAATALLAVSPALLDISRMAWSEPPFIVVTLLFLLMLGQVATKQAIGWLDVVALAALCWAAFLLRYVGASLIAVGGIVLLLELRPLDRRTIARLLGFGALSALAPVGVMLRNHAADGTYLGNRIPSHDSIGEIAGRTARTFGQWIVPVDDLPRVAGALLGGAATLLLLVGLGVALRGRWRAGDPQRDRRSTSHLIACAVMAVVYLLYLTGAALSTSFEPTNSRYLSPVLVPAVVVGAFVVHHLARRGGRAGASVALGLTGVLIAGHLVAAIGDARAAASRGIGFSTSAWAESHVAAEALDVVMNSARGVVYSNNPNGLWAADHLQPIHWSPRRVGFRGEPLAGELDRFVDAVRCSSTATYLVVYLIVDARVIPLAELREVLELEKVRSAADGVVFRVTAREAGSCDEAEGRPTLPR